MVNESVNGVSVVSDQGQRMAWQFDETVIAQIKGFKPGDPVVVIYRERGGARRSRPSVSPARPRRPSTSTPRASAWSS